MSSSLVRLCKHFIDIFEFEVIHLLNTEWTIADNWFLEWLSEDLKAFKSLCEFVKATPEENKPLLENIRERVIDLGRLKCCHSTFTYRNFF